MSVWTRLFGRSKPSQPKSKPRLGLESLEMREVPAIVFVGGWGASQYQYSSQDSGQRAGGRSVNAADYSAIAFVGGWGASPSTGDSLPTEQLSMNYAKVRFDAAPVSGSLAVPEPRSEATVTVEYLTLGTFAIAGGTACSGRDVLVGGQSVDTTASDHPSGKLATDSVKPERDASPLPVLLVIADQRDFYSTVGAGRDVLIANQTGDRETTCRLMPDDVWVDDKIITGENFDTAAIANSGYIRIKKLNSGG